MPRNTSVILGEHFDGFVSEQIRKGRYQSVSEVIRSGLRRLEDDENKRLQLLAQLEASENSPAIAPASADEFLKRMHTQHPDKE